MVLFAIFVGAASTAVVVTVLLMFMTWPARAAFAGAVVMLTAMAIGYARSVEIFL